MGDVLIVVEHFIIIILCAHSLLTNETLPVCLSFVIILQLNNSTDYKSITKHNIITQINHLPTTIANKQQQTGSLFELSGGNPKLGFVITAVITALGLPLSVFLIYAAILKGAAETEEADREFTKVKRRL